MSKINNQEQRARFEVIMENMDEEDLEIVSNWGGELYRDGLIKGGLVSIGCIFASFGISKAISVINRRKENQCGRD